SEIQTIFAAIGVRVRFVECDTTDFGQCADESTGTTPRLKVSLLARSFLVKDADAMGVATKNLRAAHVFYDHIETFVREFESTTNVQTSLGVMLGCIVAHEVGHLLLSSGIDHRPDTLMRATWKERDLREVEIHGARIGEDQALRMRTTLLGLR